jgi:hypothetical protein
MMEDRMPFRHVLMTRFNLATPGKESDIRNRPGWLAERFDLFERYCLPSVAAQGSRAFDWIIYFDEGTPAPFRERIAACQEIVPFHAYFTGLFPGSGWPRSVREVLGVEDGLLLSTRLDNDDALAADFVARLHAAVVAGGLVPGSWNFRNGFVVGSTRAYALAHPANPFFSYLEPVGPKMRTAPSILHLDIADHGAVFQIEGAGAWAQMVHGSNVSNKLRGRLVDPSALSGRFPPAVTKRLAPVSAGTLLFERALAEPARRLRDFASETRHALAKRRPR